MKKQQLEEKKMLAKIKHTYHEFPRNFWILVGAAFIRPLAKVINVG
jgi:hypothetical protein